MNGSDWYTALSVGLYGLRKRIFEIVEHCEDDDPVSQCYDRLLILCIFCSILPLCFKGESEMLDAMDHAAVNMFIVDYFLRWLTADFRKPSYHGAAFLYYPIGFMAILDVVSVLPSLIVLNPGWKVMRLIRLSRSLRAIRLFRYSKGFRVIAVAVKKEKQALEAVLWMAIAYIFVSALVMFSVEPGSFHSFFDAVYWSVVTLTTVGYGDVYPVTDIGRLVSMLSSLVGIAIIALPTGIMTAGFMSELQNHIGDDE